MRYGDDFIIFASGNRYEYQSADEAIYIINNVEAIRIANNVTKCIFEKYMKEEKTILKITIRLSKMDTDKEIEYVLGYGNINSKYENEENYVSHTNLFDKYNANILNMYIDSNSHQLINTPTADRMKSIYISCSANTSYNISKMQSAKLALGSFTETTEGAIAEVYLSDINEGANLTDLTITTGANSQYLVVFLYDSEEDTLINFDEIINSLRIYEVNNY